MTPMLTMMTSNSSETRRNQGISPAALPPAMPSDPDEEADEGEPSTSVMAAPKSSVAAVASPPPSASQSPPPPPSTEPRHSGLSALLLAATSQLGHLAQDDDDDDDDRPAESTPTLVPVPDPSKQTLPELLMTLAMSPANHDVLAFLPNGQFLAVRVDALEGDLLPRYFGLSKLDDFVQILVDDWGFKRLSLPTTTSNSGIAVFHHPRFVHGDWDQCAKIQRRQPNDSTTTTTAHWHLPPAPQRVEKTTSEDSSVDQLPMQSKRRLSPGFLARQESESSQTIKQRVDSIDSDSTANHRSSDRMDSSYTAHSRSDDVRSAALAITAEKLHLSDRGPSDTLVDRAVESTTHCIVTDAIASLLRDEVHTKETYRKHEKALSKSSLPGIIPISQQLFSSKEKTVAPPAEVTTTTATTTSPTPQVESSLEPSPVPSPRIRSITEESQG